MTNIAHTYYPQSGSLVVLGAGESGVGTAILGKDRGFDVFVSDLGVIPTSYQQQLEQENSAFVRGQHTESLLMKSDLVVNSRGIPEKAPIVQQLRQSGKPVTSEIEFAAQYTGATLT